MPEGLLVPHRDAQVACPIHVAGRVEIDDVAPGVRALDSGVDGSSRFRLYRAVA
jgi:hypothetical protein